MNKGLDVYAEGFSQDPLETYFCKQHSPGAWIDKLLWLCQDFSKPKIIQANSSR